MLHKPAVFQGDIPQHIPTNGVWIGLELLPLQIGGESLIRNNVTQRQWRDFWNRRTKSTAILLRGPFGLDRK